MSFFALVCRAAAVALIALGYPSWVFVALGVFLLFLIPKRRNLVLIAMALFVLSIATHGYAAAGVGLGALLATLLGQKPLAMNGLDRYFIAQTRPGVPVAFHTFFEVSQPLDRPLLTRAVSSFQRDVPIAHSFVREGLFGVERFVTWTPIFGRPLRFLDRPLRDEDLAVPFDLATEPPFRVLHAPREGGGAVVVFTIHHSAADGVGAFLLMGRLFQRYDELRRGVPEQPFAKDPPPVRFRALLRPKGLRWLLAMIRRHVKPMDKVGVQNASLLDDEAPRPATSRHIEEAIPLERWDALKDAAAARGVSRNDLLLAAALRAADGWRRARNKPDRAFRVLYPIDLRAILGLPACVQNFVGVVRADFSIEDVRRDDLAKLVQERVKESRSLEEAIETPVNLGVLSAVLPPWVFRAALAGFDDDPRSFFFSLVWSNVRVPPDLVLPPGTERIYLRGPLVRQPGVGVFATLDARSLNLTLEYLSPLASEEGVRDYGSRLLAEIR